MIIIEPAVASAWLLGLGSKLYPSNMLDMLNKDLTRFMQSLSSSKRKKGSTDRVLLFVSIRYEEQAAQQTDTLSLKSNKTKSIFVSLESCQNL